MERDRLCASLSSRRFSFRDVVSSVCFRSDGALLAASDLSGLVQVFDVRERMALRSLRSHKAPARFVKYPFQDKLHLVSGGDDGVVKYWDVAGSTVISDLLGHKDYVRCGDCSPVNDKVIRICTFQFGSASWVQKALKQYAIGNWWEDDAPSLFIPYDVPESANIFLNWKTRL